MNEKSLEIAREKPTYGYRASYYITREHITDTITLRDMKLALKSLAKNRPDLDLYYSIVQVDRLERKPFKRIREGIYMIYPPTEKKALPTLKRVTRREEDDLRHVLPPLLGS